MVEYWIWNKYQTSIQNALSTDYNSKSCGTITLPARVHKVPPRVLDFVNTYPLVAHIYNQLEVDQGRVLDPQEPPVRAEIVAFLERHGEAISVTALEEELARAFEQAHQYHNERLIREEDSAVRDALSSSQEQ